MNDQDKVIMIKFRSGLEIIGTHLRSDEEIMQMKDVFQINYKISDATPIISLTRFMMLSDRDSFLFPVEEILTATPPRKMFVTYYEQAVKNFYENDLPVIEQALKDASHVLTKEEILGRVLELIPTNPDKMQ